MQPDQIWFGVLLVKITFTDTLLGFYFSVWMNLKVHENLG